MRSTNCNSHRFLGSDHGFNAIVHILNKGAFRASKSALVRNVVGCIHSLRVLSMDSTDLHVVLVCDFLELLHVAREFRKFDVHGSAQGSSQVGGARGDVAAVLVVRELADRLDVGGCSAEALEDGVDVGSLLHGDDTEFILFVHPHKESLVVVVEDTTASGPVAVASTAFEETIAFLE